MDALKSLLELCSYLHTMRELRWQISEGKRSRGAERELDNRSYEDLLLRCGVAGEAIPLPRGIRLGKLGYCFSDAAELAVSNPGRYVYVEGFALGVIPTHHAWCILRDTGQVVDRTWSAHKGPRKLGSAYLGIPFAFEYLCRQLTDTGRHSLLYDWHAGFPLLTQHWDAPEVWMDPEFIPKWRAANPA
jgi:hypothetical protein